MDRFSIARGLKPEPEKEKISVPNDKSGIAYIPMNVYEDICKNIGTMNYSINVDHVSSMSGAYTSTLLGLNVITSSAVPNNTVYFIPNETGSSGIFRIHGGE